MMPILIMVFNISLLFYFARRPKRKVMNAYAKGKLLLLKMTMISTPNSFQAFAKDLPEFKIYTDLIYDLGELQRLFGTSVVRPLKEIREALQRDLQFTGKKLEIIRGALLQFIMLVAITWIFAFATTIIVNLSITLRTFLFMLLLQIVGFLFFHWRLKRSEHQIFFNIEELLMVLYRFRALSLANLPQSHIIEKAQIPALLSQIENSKNETLKVQGERIKELLFKWKKSGGVVTEEIGLLIDDSWSMMENAHEKFNRSITIFKFIVIFVTILPSYFVFLYSLLRYLLTI